ncbi:MAG: 2-C-methyl-D-erythritol 4-phosphate cytidylyltransferase [Gammaproteobacteria bacterium]|nr:2-C-methyl-D-erythritol 4-phosphate cytidylyltransferase [Gammaproteobacteria bacterium]
MRADPQRCWAIVPAAGSGSRMNAGLPKQYLELHGRTVLARSLSVLLTCDRINAVVIALAETDPYWPELAESRDSRVHTVIGASSRAGSVLNALNYLDGKAALDDLVLVHDAARPCLRAADLQKLLDAVEDTVGGLLALPVHDTMKRSDAAGLILETVSREHLWHAQTPQCFAFGPLREALETALHDGLVITDEASAMEAAGYKPLLVEGSPDNIKITRPADLQLAKLYLSLAATELGDD